MSYTDPESASKSERTSRLICEFRCCTSLSRHTSEPTRAAALPLPNTRPPSQRRSIDRRGACVAACVHRRKGTENEQLATRGHHHWRLTGHRREPGDGLPQARLCSGRQLPHDRRERRPDGSDGARRYRADGRRSAHRRRCHGKFRPGRHGGQQRRDLHSQAVHRLHRRGLRRHHGSEPSWVLRGFARGGGRDAVTGGWRSHREHLHQPRRPRQLCGALGVGVTDQGRAERGNQGAGCRICRPRHSLQRCRRSA